VTTPAPPEKGLSGRTTWKERNFLAAGKATGWRADWLPATKAPSGFLSFASQPELQARDRLVCASTTAAGSGVGAISDRAEQFTGLIGLLGALPQLRHIGAVSQTRAPAKSIRNRCCAQRN
jgi:hypothetical protein